MTPADGKGLAQEHARRVELLGERIADEWAAVVNGHGRDRFESWMVLQLMEEAYRQGRNSLRTLTHVRWSKNLSGDQFGHAGDLLTPLFRLVPEEGAWFLYSHLPGDNIRPLVSGTEAEMKELAERWLWQFLDSLKIAGDRKVTML